MLETRGLERRPDPEGGYTFFGGCYTWSAPQNGPLGWKSAEGESVNWPPDPAMDRGPARIAGRSRSSLTMVGPRGRSGLLERTEFALREDGAGELRVSLRNEGDEARVAGAWVNTAAGKDDVIALWAPEGTGLRGWDEASAGRLEAIMEPPTASGWARVDLRKASWEGGIKVYVEAATGGGPSRIAVWRGGYWFVRTGAAMNASAIERLREMGEGPVAVYIQPGGAADDDGIVEMELYAPVEKIAPGEEARWSEAWRVIPAPGRGDMARLPE